MKNVDHITGTTLYLTNGTHITATRALLHAIIVVAKAEMEMYDRMQEEITEFHKNNVLNFERKDNSGLDSSEYALENGKLMGELDCILFANSQASKAFKLMRSAQKALALLDE